MGLGFKPLLCTMIASHKRTTQGNNGLPLRNVRTRPKM